MHKEFLRKGLSSKISHAVEECGEFIQAAGKTLRFGPESANPLLPLTEQETNKTWLLREMNDLRLTLAMLELELMK